MLTAPNPMNAAALGAEPDVYYSANVFLAMIVTTDSGHIEIQDYQIMRTGIGQTVCAKFPGRLPTVRWEVNVDALIGAIEPLHHVPQPHDSLVTQVPVGPPQNMSNTIPYKKNASFLVHQVYKFHLAANHTAQSSACY